MKLFIGTTDLTQSDARIIYNNNNNKMEIVMMACTIANRQN